MSAQFWSIKDGSTGGRLKLVVPAETKDAILQMTRASLSDDVRKYIIAVLDRVGRVALTEARGRLGVFGVGPRVTVLSAAIRENQSRRSRSFTQAPLRDEGGLASSLRATVDRGNLTVSLGAVGRHAYKAALHERGYTFGITERMANYFFHRANQERLGRGRRAMHLRVLAAFFRENVGETVRVRARPFLQPSLERAYRTVLEDGFRGTKGMDLARDLFNIWGGGRVSTAAGSVRTTQFMAEMGPSIPEGGEDA